MFTHNFLYLAFATERKANSTPIVSATAMVIVRCSLPLPIGEPIQHQHRFSAFSFKNLVLDPCLVEELL